VRIGCLCVVSGEFFKLSDLLCRSLCIYRHRYHQLYIWGLGGGGV